MPTQDSYSPLSVADANTFATGYYKDPVTGKLTTHSIPATFLYGGKWTVGVGVPSTPGVGPGDQYLNVTNGDTYTWDNTGQTWGQPTGTLINGSYQFPIWIAGPPLANEKIYSFAAPTAFIFQTGMVDSLASADSAAVGTAVFSLTKNGVQFATVTFNAGQNTGIIACNTLTSFLEGDIFEVIAPASQDAGLSNVRLSLVAIRPSGAALSDIISSGDAANSAAAAAASATAADASAQAANSSAGTAAGSATSASGSASSASGSATTATLRAADAAGSATAASGSAGSAASSATSASGSATSAATSAANAHTSEVNAAASAATVADALTYISGRNLIINGRGDVAQRGTSVTYATNQTGFGGPDRWRVVLGATGGSCTQSQSTMVGLDGVTRSAIRQTVTTVATTLTTTNYWQGIHQLIEGYRAHRMLGKTITVSGLFRASLAGQYTVSLRTSDGTALLQTFTCAANTVTPYSFQVAVPSNASIPNSAGVWGFIVNIGAYGTGVMTSVINTWQATNANGSQMVATGSVAWPLTASAWIETTDVQVEVGDRQTPYEEDSWEDVLDRCRRYYQLQAYLKMWGYQTAGNGIGNFYNFPITMCKTPTLKSAGTLTQSNCSGTTYETLAAHGFSLYTLATATGTLVLTVTGAAFEAEL